MNNINKLVIYLNSKIKELEESYNINEINKLKELIEKNIVLFDLNIKNLDLELVERIFNEFYNEELAIKKYELFLELREFSDELSSNINEPQIQICLKYIKEFKELFNTKLQKLNEQLLEIENNLQVKIDEYKNVLSFFENGKLIKLLSNQELENLFIFLSNIGLDEEILYDLIVEITSKNIELYDKKRETIINDKLKQIKRNSSKISKLIDTVVQQETVLQQEELSKEEPGLVEDIIEIIATGNLETNQLTEEEEVIYNKILEIYENLKSENINLSFVDDVLDLIKENDFTLEETRKELYNSNWSLENVWGVILVDLEKNLLPNFTKNKQQIIEIFKYIIDLYDKNYISKRDFILQLPLISDTEEINHLVTEYLLLPEDKKKYILSMKSIVDVYGFESLKSYSLDISYQQLCYYLYIKEIKELFEIYNEKIKEDIVNDKSLANILISEITDIKTKLLDLLEKISALKEEVKEDLEEHEEVSLSYENLLLFVPNSNSKDSIHDTLISNIEALKKNYRDDYREYIAQSILAIDERLLKTPFSQIRNLSQVGGKRGKTKNKNGILENDHNKPKLDEYNVFRYKPRIGTGARVCYMILKISENNKIKLKDYFKMQSLGNICLVINIDASVKDEKEYVKRTHDILVAKEDTIKRIIDIFANDFTKETYKIAIELIERSMSECLSLKDIFCKSEEKNIGENND